MKTTKNVVQVINAKTIIGCLKIQRKNAESDLKLSSVRKFGRVAYKAYKAAVSECKNEKQLARVNRHLNKMTNPKAKTFLQASSF